MHLVANWICLFEQCIFDIFTSLLSRSGKCLEYLVTATQSYQSTE